MSYFTGPRSATEYFERLEEADFRGDAFDSYDFDDFDEILEFEGPQEPRKEVPYKGDGIPF